MPAARGADAYEIQISSNKPDEANWAHPATVTATKSILTGLPVNHRCNFRVQSIEAGGSKAISKGVPQLQAAWLRCWRKVVGPPSATFVDRNGLNGGTVDARQRREACIRWRH